MYSHSYVHPSTALNSSFLSCFETCSLWNFMIAMVCLNHKYYFARLFGVFRSKLSSYFPFSIDVLIVFDKYIKNPCIPHYFKVCLSFLHSYIFLFSKLVLCTVRLFFCNKIFLFVNREMNFLFIWPWFHFICKTIEQEGVSVNFFSLNRFWSENNKLKKFVCRSLPVSYKKGA